MSIIIGRPLIVGGGGVAPDIDFEYSGQYIRRAEDNVVEFLSTGVLTIKKDVYTDLFLVGGGGGGVVNSTNANGGGGGGYTKTVLNVLLNKGTYNIEIGAGGAGGTAGSGADGGATSITGNNGLFATADGGKHAQTSFPGAGGNGGSGGGGGSYAYRTGSVNGGTGGADGASGGSGRGSGGTGQGTTTREFGEATGKLYAGGGGGGGYYNSGYDANPGAGGAGGGGNGARLYGSVGDGTPNTGGGGGGGFDYVGMSSGIISGGSGGSGIVCIRVHKE